MQPYNAFRVTFCLVLLAACAADPAPMLATRRSPGLVAAPTPPTANPLAAEAVPLTETLHGAQVSDPWRWLENADTPRVQDWMARHDEAARKALAALPGREALAKRFAELFYVESLSAPIERGGKLFFLKTSKDKEKAVLYVRDGEKGKDRILIDPNVWSPDGSISLGGFYPSRDGKKLLYARKPNAADEATLYLLDVATGKVSEQDVIEGAKYAYPLWTPDGKGFYYAYAPTDPSIPVAERPGRTDIRFHVLGDKGPDQIVHPPTGDPATFLNVDLSEDGRQRLIEISRGWTDNDVYLHNGLVKNARLEPVILGRGARYEVIADGQRLFIATDEGASNLRVFSTNVATPGRDHWKEIVPEDPSAALDRDAFRLIGGTLVLHYMKDASSELRLVSLDGKKTRKVALPTFGSVTAIRGRPSSPIAYVEFSSFLRPKQIYSLDVRTGTLKLWGETKLPIQPDHFEVEQSFIPSKDGTKVPVFLVHRKGLAKDGANPVLLYGYGGFNVSQRPSFRASIYPWLEAGGVYAVANLRGGGEYGKRWHEAGRLHQKQNVFDDFEAVASWLASSGWSRPEKIAIYGGSNGGLLVGAAMTQRPELMGAVVCAVPLLDMVRYHLFGSGRTWIPEYGTAENAEDFATLYAYSPYHHVQPGTKYPPLLMLSADHDDRVDPLHARKFVATVQAATAGEPPLLRIERNAGHTGADQVSKAIEQSVDMYSFLMAKLGVTPPSLGEAASR